jgi:hypothetical protein
VNTDGTPTTFYTTGLPNAVRTEGHGATFATFALAATMWASFPLVYHWHVYGIRSRRHNGLKGEYEGYTRGFIVWRNRFEPTLNAAGSR